MDNKNTWYFHVDNFPEGKTIWPCRISIPVCPDFKIFAFSVVRPDNSIVPAQSRTIVKYPSGSPRWIQLDFTGNGNGLYKITNKSCVDKNQNSLYIEKIDDGFIIQSNRLKIVLNKKNSFLIQSIIWKDINIAYPNEEWNFIVKVNDEIFDIKSGLAENFKVEACGENRFQVSWENFHINQKSSEKILKCRFRLEMLTGIEGFSLSYQFFHCLAGHPFIDIESISCDFIFPSINKKALILQEMYGNFAQQKVVEAKQKIDIFLDKNRFSPYVKKKEVLNDFQDYPIFLQDLNDVVGETTGIKNKDTTLLCCMKDFIHQRPKSITVKPGSISFGIWPEFAGILHLQQGMSKRSVFNFLFLDGENSRVSELLSKNQNYIEPIFCLVNQDDSKIAGKTWYQSLLFSEKHREAGIFSSLMSSATARFHTISEMFHYGDTPDEGYTQYYASSGRFPALKEKKDVYFNTSGGVYHIQSNLEPVWSNNEYDAIYCLALEFLRSKNVSVFKRLTSAARHQIEVDFVHYSDHWQQHRSTPQHSYCHTRTMSSLPSHQWTQGLYYYYALTGDDDVDEIIRAICDFDMTYFEKTIYRFNDFFNREYGWAILALVYGYEATGNEPYIRKAARLIKELGKNTKPEQAKLFGLGFYQNTVLLGLMAYHQATGEKWVKELFLKWVNEGMKNFTDMKNGVQITELFVEPAVYAYYLTKNKNYLKKEMWQFELFLSGWNNMGWISGMDILSTKKYARVYRGLVYFISACCHAGVLKDLLKNICQTDSIE